MVEFHIQYQSSILRKGKIKKNIFFIWQLNLFRREKIAEAIKDYSEKTCINFMPKLDSDIDYVHILPDEGCYSLVGKVGK